MKLRSRNLHQSYADLEELLVNYQQKKVEVLPLKGWRRAIEKHD